MPSFVLSLHCSENRDQTEYTDTETGKRHAEADTKMWRQTQK